VLLFIKTLWANKQYDTDFEVKEESHFRSQKQRVSIARAIIKTPNLTFFDDCLSAVDTETEEAILNNLFEICKDNN
jgi:ATP-binding cassette subfamily B protein